MKHHILDVKKDHKLWGVKNDIGNVIQFVTKIFINAAIINVINTAITMIAIVSQAIPMTLQLLGQHDLVPPDGEVTNPDPYNLYQIDNAIDDIFYNISS